MVTLLIVGDSLEKLVRTKRKVQNIEDSHNLNYISYEASLGLKRPKRLKQSNRFKGFGLAPTAMSGRF